ncbi:hypothetical protein ID866_8767 [Astraeus odoratus]|nr:hypothetical protein ID866_8767 [Astraeus odoratus]
MSVFAFSLHNVTVSMDTQAIFDPHTVVVLPKGEGLLPKWQLLVAVIGIFNTIQNFVTLKLTHKVYTGVPPSYVSALQARTFAVWTLTSAVVRGYAAYHLYDKRLDWHQVGSCVQLSFIHFSTSHYADFVFPSAAVSLIWMLRFHDFYVKP